MADKVITRANAFVSTYTLKPEKREEFFAIWTPRWQSSIEFLNENTNFVFYGVGRDPNVIVAIESYIDEAGLAERRKSPAFQETVLRMLECCSKPMTMELFSGLNMGREIFNLYPAGKSTVHPSSSKGSAIFL